MPVILFFNQEPGTYLGEQWENQSNDIHGKMFTAELSSGLHLPLNQTSTDQTRVDRDKPIAKSLKTWGGGPRDLVDDSLCYSTLGLDLGLGLGLVNNRSVRNFYSLEKFIYLNAQYQDKTRKEETFKFAYTKGPISVNRLITTINQTWNYGAFLGPPLLSSLLTSVSAFLPIQDHPWGIAS